MGNVENRRKLQRRHLIYYLRVFDIDSHELVGHIMDITVEGALLISECPIHTNRTFRLKMILPDEINRSKEIQYTAKSVWCKKDQNPDFYNTGFQFQIINPADENRISRLIDLFGRETHSL